MLDRAKFYNGLAEKIFGRDIPCTILIHHSLLNALFLDDLINMFIQNGWQIVNASDAFKDYFTAFEPDVLPAGESIVWSIAKQTGKYHDILRYPGEHADMKKQILTNIFWIINNHG